MVIGSHNTFTYLQPRKWWMYVMIPFAQCQSKSIQEQDVECFDLRVRWDKEGWILAHGEMEFKYPNKEYLSDDDIINIMLEFKSTLKYLRVTLETKERDLSQEEKFARLCQSLQDTMKLYGIKVFGGTRKFDWFQVFVFDANPKYEQWIGSMQSFYGKICPWLWNFFNKDKVPQYDDKVEILLKDFV